MSAELDHARKALSERNDGRARACARRAVGILLKEYFTRKQELSDSPRSAVDRLKEVSAGSQFPENIQKAAQRLVTHVNNRLSPDFTLHPVHDAEILITYFKKLL